MRVLMLFFYLFITLLAAYTMVSCAIGTQTVVNGPPTWGCK